MKYIAATILLCLFGCGKDETVQVGAEGDSGVVKTNIDKAKVTADEESARTHEGESIAYGQ